MISANDSLIERVQNSFRQLTVASIQLNAVSDELGKLIIELEAAIKKLNLGIEAWVQVRGSSSNGAFWSDDLGYAKVDGKWGIALRSVSGHEGADAYGSNETKLFNEAARDKRVAAVDKLPDLIEQLLHFVATTTEGINDGLETARGVVAAVSSTNQEPPKMVRARLNPPAETRK